MIEIVVATINGLVALTVLALGILLNRKVNKVKDQVVNGHHTNLRDESDERHLENSGKLDLLVKEIPRIRDNIGKIFDRLDRHTDEIHALQLTQPSPKHLERRKAQ